MVLLNLPTRSYSLVPIIDSSPHLHPRDVRDWQITASGGAGHAEAKPGQNRRDVRRGLFLGIAAVVANDERSASLDVMVHQLEEVVLEEVVGDEVGHRIDVAESTRWGPVPDVCGPEV